MEMYQIVDGDKTEENTGKNHDGSSGEPHDIAVRSPLITALLRGSRIERYGYCTVHTCERDELLL